ncbi:hypothetical protein [Rhodococcoides yunnanense]|uniref:hypothetical protein n=1 Tax=Rhodococcoides yunnanense TaxID=278209 RepID=UPI0011148C04|nr:hypothetical protein [Rhodococcus yunnanensis]
MTDDKLIDLRAAERRHGAVRETYLNWHKAGELELHKIGGKWFVDRDELDTVAAAHGMSPKVLTLEEHIAKVVAAAPPLTPETRAKIAALLGVGLRNNAA